MASKNTRNFEFKLGKQALVLFILGMSFLFFCVFLFGVVVGKHIDAYPELIAQGIPDMIRNKLGFGKEKAPTEVAVGEEAENAGSDEQDEFDLTFYDTLAKKNTGGANAAHRVKAGAETAKAPAPVSGTATGNAREKAPGNGAGNGPRVDVAGDANALPAGGQADEGDGNKSLLAGDAGQGRSGAGAAAGGYIIHVASFREKGSSEQLAKKLAARGYAASVQMRDLPGKGKWFRVVVSDFKTREEARKALDAMDTQIRGLKATILAAGEKQN